MTGIQPGCAVSEGDELWASSKAVGWFLSRGYAVAFGDYAGLAENTGSHLPLQPESAAYNVIDSVRAIRELYPNVSSSWVAFGESQGGHAVWSANELGNSYGAGLNLKGVVAVSPAANVTPLAELAYSERLEPEQFGTLPLIVAGLARFDSSIKTEDFLHGFAAERLESIIGCTPEARPERKKLSSSDIKPIDEQAMETLRTALRKVALPQRPLSAPMLVVYGSDDYTIFPEWVKFSVKLACEQGAQIETRRIKGMRHGDLAQDDAVAKWIAARFAGAPAKAGCS
jgi:hypothetical protein